MECWECEDDPGERHEVKYADGSIETVNLCEKCREKFRDGDLVSGVQSIQVD